MNQKLRDEFSQRIVSLQQRVDAIHQDFAKGRNADWSEQASERENDEVLNALESEAKVEIDRFIDALISIREEIAKVESGQWTLDNNPLVFAPHTSEDVLDPNWDRAYARDYAAFPCEAVKQNKFWPTVTRIDDVYGDRNLICSCPDIDSYRDE